MAIMAKWPKILAIFFVFFNQDNVFFIVVEFQSDRMSPRESAKNGRIGSNGLNYKIFVKAELIFEIYDKNYSRKKNFYVPKTLLKIS